MSARNAIFWLGLLIGVVAVLAQLAGVKLTHVPFKGSAEVHTAVASKQIMVAAMNIGEALQYQRGGTPLRHLGQMSEKRSSLAPQVPTFKEQGFDLVATEWYGLLAPAKTPPDVVAKLEKTALDILAKPDMKKKLTDAGFEVTAKNGKQHMERVAREVKLFKDVIEQAKITKL